MEAKSKLILMRHGESAWNKLNLFTGWVDIPLSQQGIQEAMEAGKQIQDEPIDVAFTSTLVRAQETLAIAMAYHRSGKVLTFLHPGEGKLEEWGKIYSPEAQSKTIPVYRAWQLNERMYGALQGLNKDEMRAKYGAEQVQIWRRSYDVAPPEGESLKICAERTLPYFDQEIIPHLKAGKTVLISAHGNSLRSIIMELDQLTEQQVVALELPLGRPIFYAYESGKFIK
jgi:2,3-bisphosphoglycerate-dependent phosphoglycerate mutase